MPGKLTAFLLLAALAPAGWAEIYQWRDEQGRMHFGDKPAPHLLAKPVELGPLNTMTPVAIPEDLFNPKQTGAKAEKGIALPRLGNGAVVMYSTPTCVFCGQARDYMKRKGIPYQEKDIIVSRASKEEFVAYGGRGVPLIFIGTPRGTEKLRGFSEKRFESIYYSH